MRPLQTKLYLQQHVGHVEAPCCKIFYPCKLCHDERYDYKQGCQVQRMEFQKVQKIKCLHCKKIQPPSQICIKCEIRFGEYSCIPCRLYENHPSKVKDIFHCNDCKMCRRGTRDTYTHCFVCGYCVPDEGQQKHKCLVNNSESHCPICLQTLMYSTKIYASLRCGHLIHVACQKMLKDINCPLCGMACRTMSRKEIRIIDLKIWRAGESLSSRRKSTKVSVLCNQCLHKTLDAPFHFYGIKCQKCKSYNTKII